MLEVAIQIDDRFVEQADATLIEQARLEQTTISEKDPTPMQKNRVLEKLRQNKAALVTTVTPYASAKLTEMIGLLDFDCVWIDMEHQDYSFDQLFEMSLGCRATGIEPMIRIRKGDYWTYSRPFEAGATGIMVPHCRSGAEAAEIVKYSRFHPLGMRGMDGVEANADYGLAPMAEYMAILTTYDDDEVLSSALRAGAAGFLLKDAPAEDVIRAVRSVAEGGAWLDPAVTGRVLKTYRASAPPAAAAQLGSLTQREAEVLRLIGRGASNHEIADTLVISEATVKSHMRNLRDKLEVRRRTEIVYTATRQGIV